MKSKRYNKQKPDINKSLIAPELCTQYMITPQEAIFVAQYTKEWNEIDALKKAGLYPVKGTATEARKIANKLLNKSAIAVAVQQASQYRVERMLGSKDMIISHLFRIAKSDPANAYDDNGHIKPLKDIPYELRCCISKIKTRSKYKYDKGTKENNFDGYITEFELESHTSALKELARLLMPQLVNVTQNNVTQNNMDLSHLSKEKTEALLEILSGAPRDTNILELERIEECNLEH